MTGPTTTPPQPPAIELQRVEAEFQSLNQTFGSAPTSPLMAPSTLDVTALTLTLPINPPGIAPKINLRYRGAKADIRDRAITSATIKLTADETVDLIGVELTDNGYLTRLGTVCQAPPVVTPPFPPVSIIAPVGLANTTDEVSIVAATLPTGSLKAGSTFRITVRGSIHVKGTSGSSGVDSGSLKFVPFLGATVALQVYEMAGRDAVLGPAAFFLEVDVTVRTIGAPGTYVTNGFGSVGFSPTDVRPILPTSIGAPASVDTVAPSQVVKLTAKWDKKIDGNNLQVDVATIAQIV